MIDQFDEDEGPQGAPVPTPDVIPGLHAAFEAFTRAVLEDDLNALDAILTGACLARGKDLREAVLFGTRDKLEALDPYTQVSILGFRATSDRDALEAMGYANYFAYALTFFAGGRNFLEALSIGHIIAGKDGEEEFFAGQLVVGDEPHDLAVRFLPDGDAWRVDPVAVHALYANLTLALIDERFNADADGFIEAYVRDMFEPEDIDALWEPVAT